MTVWPVDDFPPLFPVLGRLNPIVLGKSDKSQIVYYHLPPGFEWAATWAVVGETGKEDFFGESSVGHSGYVSEPAKSAGAHERGNGCEAAFLAQAAVGDVTVGGIADAKAVSEAAMLEGLESAGVITVWGPGLRAIQEGGEDGGFVDSEFVFE